MILQEALPEINHFLKPVGLNQRRNGLVVRCVAAFCLHWGRMSSVQAAGVVRSEPRHRAEVCPCTSRNPPERRHRRRCSGARPCDRRRASGHS